MGKLDLDKITRLLSSTSKDVAVSSRLSPNGNDLKSLSPNGEDIKRELKQFEMKFFSEEEGLKYMTEEEYRNYMNSDFFHEYKLSEESFVEYYKTYC